MSKIVLLDSGPLGLVTNPRGSAETKACNLWLEALLSRNVKVQVPEIADYEVRRELLRVDKIEGVRRLDALKLFIDYIPLTTQAMLLAAQFWANVRKQGMPTTDNKALDGDVILAAQAAVLQMAGHEVIIATTNVNHLSRLAIAKEWRYIE